MELQPAQPALLGGSKVTIVQPHAASVTQEHSLILLLPRPAHCAQSTLSRSSAVRHAQGVPLSNRQKGSQDKHSAPWMLASSMTAAAHALRPPQEIVAGAPPTKPADLEPMQTLTVPPVPAGNGQNMSVMRAMSNPPPQPACTAPREIVAGATRGCPRALMDRHMRQACVRGDPHLGVQAHTVLTTVGSITNVTTTLQSLGRINFGAVITPTCTNAEEGGALVKRAAVKQTTSQVPRATAISAMWNTEASPCMQRKSLLRANMCKDMHTQATLTTCVHIHILYMCVHTHGRGRVLAT